MQSAEEFAHDVWQAFEDGCGYKTLIRARDREIVEACKKAIMRQASGIHVNIEGVDYALDSVLRDLG